MNDGIRYASRPNDTKPKNEGFGGLPPEVIGMARQMGLSPEDVKQMSSMWANMDDLSNSDPEAYKQFTQEILAEGPNGDKENASSTRARSFLPVPSFVVKVNTTAAAGNGLKVTTRSGLAKVFINMASCEALEPPKDVNGRPMEKGQRRGADGLQIPLLVGEVRRCTDHSGEEGAALAVDVVFHPWIIDRCDDDNTFKAQAIDLALGWVEQETGYKFEKHKWKTIKSKYKGGSGDLGDQPMPFPVDRALEQDGPVEERKKPDESPSPPAPTPPAGLSTLSPESLLRAATSEPATDQPMDIKMPGTPGFSGKDSSSSSSAEPPRVLISEVGAPKPKVKAKAAVKKGFLHSKEGKGAPRLYDDSGSTGDGSKEGSYSRLMSKCNVVDMNTMTPAEQKIAMEKYAGTPEGGAPAPPVPAETSPPPSAAAAAPKPAPPPPSSGKEESSSLAKGFLSKSGGSLYGDGGSSEGAPKRSSQTDAHFDSLIAGIDPDYAAATSGSDDLGADDTLSALSDIAKVLGGSGPGSSSPSEGLMGAMSAMGADGGGVSLEDRPPARHTPLGGIDHELPAHVLAAGSTVAAAGKGLQHAWTLGLDTGKGKRTGTLAVPLESMEGVDLEVSAGEVRVTTAGGKQAYVSLPFAADGDSTKAKYSKSTKTLKVTVIEA